MNLYLVRHGESIASGHAEHTLSAKGIEQTQRVARFLQKAGCVIDEIMHSEKWRAKQTAQIIGEIVAPDLTMIQRVGLKPNDPVAPFVEEIVSFDRNVMVVSHLPFLENLLTTLVLGTEMMSPVDFCGSCVVCLVGGGFSWQIAWVITPELLTFCLAQ